MRSADTVLKIGLNKSLLFAFPLLDERQPHHSCLPPTSMNLQRIVSTAKNGRVNFASVVFGNCSDKVCALAWRNEIKIE